MVDRSTLKRAVLVLSGKGGVGKSTMSVQLAMSLAFKGRRVGLLDVDICGPSLARMLAKESSEITQSELGWKPVKVRQDLDLFFISMALLTENKDSAVIWRGPKKHSMIEKFIRGVDWTCVDELIIDTPPGTSDEHISLVEVLRSLDIPVSGILVTTPQIVACNDVRKEISFCRSSGVQIIGLIENMSGFTCPHCSNCTKIFSSEGGLALCKYADIKFLGSIPIDPNLCQCSETGESFIELYKDSKVSTLINQITDNIPIN